MSTEDLSLDIAAQADSLVDLHLHSSCSDGNLSPAKVMAAAKKHGLSAAALTDHDTVAGIDEAERAAAELELEFIPGIELSSYDETGSTHLLGYSIDARDGNLIAFLKGARESRVSRAAEIVDKLNRLGIEISLEDVVAQTQGLVARPHIARAMLVGGWVTSYAEAFNRYIAAGQPAYVPTRFIDPPNAIRRIHEAGGLAVLAHGGKSHGPETIGRLVDAGLDGLEVVHPEHGPVEVRELQRLAAVHGLLQTGGSDWHGPRGERRGPLGSMPVPYEWFERLREAAVSRRGAGERS